MLHLLSRSESAALRKYLQSPYHNARADVVLLLDCLLSKKTINLEAPLDRKAIFKAVYPDVDFDNKQLNYVVSYLIKLMEGFIAQEEYEQSIQDQSLNVLRGFRQRRWLHLCERAHRNALKKIENQPFRNAAYHRKSFEVSNEFMREQTQHSRIATLDYNKLSEAHEKAFFIEKLQLGCMIQSRQAVATNLFETGFLPMMLDFLKGHPWLQDPSVAAWYHGFHIQSNHEAIQDFESLKKVIFQHGSLFNDVERHDLFLLAVNFSIRRINSGDPAFARILFELYQEGLGQHVFLENGVITRWSYNNIVNAALKMGEITWSLQFLEEYRPKLEPAFRDTNYYFNLARCLYEQGLMDKALESLLRMEYDDVLQNLSAKTLQVKIYYDTQSWQALDSLLDSMSIYMRRKKVLGYHKENYTNIVRLVQRLIALPPGERAAKQDLKQEIESCKVLSEKGWLLKKI